MSSVRRVVAYVADRLDQIQEAPEMWGAAACVEVQVLQLLEIWVVAVRPELDDAEPRFVLDRYERFRAQLGAPVHAPPSDTLAVQPLVARLRAFREALASELGSRTP